MNADQPPCMKFVVTEADLKRQEDKVTEVRDRLAKVLGGDPKAVQGMGFTKYKTKRDRIHKVKDVQDRLVKVL